MGLTTFRFFLFLIVLVIVYFAVPKKLQWMILLAGSLFFYSLTGAKNLVFILITAASSYGAAIWMSSLTDKSSAYIKANKETLTKEERKTYKKHTEQQRKLIMAGTLVLNFGLLCVFKYINFIITQLNVLLTAGGLKGLDFLTLIVPLGISFYTFQTMGYVVDVYWEKVPANRNFLKLLLFTSFFPQITQGPISDYRQLTGELFTEHEFTYKNFSWGVQRFIWGMAKKLALADIAGSYVAVLFKDYRSYTGITVLLGAVLYSIQIYADFSGYMDMMCGFCEILGIKLTENFERPYFSKSIDEYWRRWHISLGAWFRTYLYYPIACSKLARNIGKWGKSHIGTKFGKEMPGTIALVVVWFITGLWHGATWGYIIWGLMNGLFIIATLWLGPVYAKCTELLHINTESRLWKLFQVLRTFVILTFIKIFPEIGGFDDGIAFWKQIFTNHTLPKSFAELMPYVEGKIQLVVMIVMALILLSFSLIERRTPVRVYFNKIPTVPRVLILSTVFVLAILFGWRASGLSGGFMYANF